MKKIPDNLRDVFSARMSETKLDQGTRRDYLKWLQFYIDFCGKYRHPFRNRDSLFFTGEKDVTS